MIDRSEEPIWAPSKQKIDSSNIKNFSKYLSKCDLGDYNDYDELWDWSVDNIESFSKYLGRTPTKRSLRCVY